MSAHTSETPPLARRLREGSHSSKYDSELSRTLSEAANVIDALFESLVDLREHCGNVAPFANSVATKATVADIRRVGKFLQACDRADAAIARAEGRT